ncbi:MAG: hypothetical protein RMJ14_05895 [Nitrososphaerota archaeon]|nr:hypothetical protein [Aigarchaeota archaeon]MDW8077145.1 hypothetical protein [Nitrososphaerota archaeon]
MELKIEVRMSPRLFSSVPLVYSGVGLRYFHTGFIPSGLMHVGKWLWRFYPLTLVKLNRTRECFEEVLFSFCFIYQSVNGKRFFVTQPITFAGIGHEDFEFFMGNVEDFAREACLDGIDVELHQLMDKYVSYPTSYSCISYDLSKITCDHDTLVKQLKLMGYGEHAKVWTYGVDLPYGDEQPLSLQDVSPEKFKEIFTHRSSFPYKSWTLPTPEHYVKPFDDLQISEAVFKDGMPEAAFLIKPDLLEFVRKYGTPVPQLYQRILGKHPFDGLKIVEWFAKDTDVLLTSLKKLMYSEGLKGFRRIEIAGIQDRSDEVKHTLSGAGFRTICCTTILSKELV